MKVLTVRPEWSDSTKTVSGIPGAGSVARSGFYKWLNCETSKRKEREEKYTKLVLDTYEEYKAAYGARRIAEELNDLGYKCSENYIAKIMKDNEIKALNGKASNIPRRVLQ